MTNPLSAIPGAVGMSAATEAGISAEMAAATSAGAAILTGVRPMAADLDSALFANALNAAGGAYLATAMEHVGQRNVFAGSQNLAAGTYVATEEIRATNVSL